MGGKVLHRSVKKADYFTCRRSYKMGQQTPVEMIHSYYEISKYLDDTQKTNLKIMLGLTDEDEKRIIGLENETEFLIWCTFLDGSRRLRQ